MEASDQLRTIVNFFGFRGYLSFFGFMLKQMIGTPIQNNLKHRRHNFACAPIKMGRLELVGKTALLEPVKQKLLFYIIITT